MIPLIPFVFVLLLVSACDVPKPEPVPLSVKPVATFTPGDPDAGFDLVSRCSACHGERGGVSLDGAPFLAGQSEKYLVKAMSGYVSGQRKHNTMQDILTALSEKERSDLAAYFSQKEVVWRDSFIKHSTQQDAKKIVDDLSRQGKIVPCASCHGKDGNSRNPGAPSLSLLEPAYIEIALRSYLSGERVDPFMTNFKLVLSGVDIEKLAQYFANHKPTKTQLPNRGNPRKGEKASKNCLGCHGLKGNSLVPTIPSLAGQNSRYLVVAMQAYKKGTRKNKIMGEITHKLNKTTMENIAAYYAEQVPTKGQKVKQTKFMPLFEGGQIAAVCNGCHGNNGNSTQKGTPSLTRLHPDYIQRAISAYKNGERKYELMTTLVSYLNPVEIDKVGLYYATKTPQNTKFPGKGNAKKAREIVGACNSCHGTNGNSDKSTIPSLAGQDATYLTKAILAYQSGDRKQDDMQNAVKHLSQEDILNITTYFALQKPVAQPSRELLSPNQLAEKCDHCHGKNGFSDDPSIPRLAGQVPAYIVQALTAYKFEKRDHSIMQKMASILSLTEMDAVANYYFKKGNNK